MYGRGRSDGPYRYEHDAGTIATNYKLDDKLSTSSIDATLRG